MVSRTGVPSSPKVLLIWFSRCGDAAASAAVLAKYWAGTFCLLGHMFPCFFQFRGFMHIWNY